MGEAKPAQLYVPAQGAAAWGTMPGIDARALAHVRHRLPLVRAMLGGAHAAIACLHVELAPRRTGYRCTLWRGDVRGGFRVGDAGREVSAGALSEICASFAPLARHLAARWPERARPPVIGLATDGHRVVFNAEHPSCAGTAWMERHLSGRSPCVVLVDDGSAGVLEEICPVEGRKQ